MDFICFSDIPLIIFHESYCATTVNVTGDDNTSEPIEVNDFPLGCSNESTVVYVSDFNNYNLTIICCKSAGWDKWIFHFQRIYWIFSFPV